MSRMGKKPVSLEGASVEINGQDLRVKGPKGQMNITIDPLLEVECADSSLVLKMREDTKQSRSVLGMQRTLVHNMVQGVTKGFEVTVVISGVGYRASMDGRRLQPHMGKSHSEFMDVPQDIEVKLVKPTELVFSGIDKQKVNQFAHNFCRFRPVEPYKGKGIYLKDQKIVRKEGKKK